MEPKADPALAAEAILAVTGIFVDDAITPEQGKKAEGLAARWRAEVAAFLDQKSPKAFKLPKARDHEKVLDRLIEGHDDAKRQLLVRDLTDPDVAVAYLDALGKAVAELRERWPGFTIDSPIGERYVVPGVVERGRARSFLAVIESPDRVLAEMRAGTLTTAQADLFKDVFPRLHQMLAAILGEEINARKRDKKYRVVWDKERVLRTLFGMKPALSLTRAEQKPEKGTPKIRVDFSRLRTRAQTLEAGA